jgi:aspartyl/glutamyl-tRNA(Asn/Gln) amidotransferase C subunit
MSVTQEQIEKLSSALSKIKTDASKSESGINSILKYIDVLNHVDTTDVVPTISSIKKETVLREDIEVQSNLASELLACSPQKIISNQIALSNIMK